MEQSDSAEHLRQELDQLRRFAQKSEDDVCQALGKALGYPWFKDSPDIFPGATEACGVCVGDHVAESIAEEAARTIIALKTCLRECASDLEQHIESEYPKSIREQYPSEMRRYERDITPVLEAKRLLNGVP